MRSRRPMKKSRGSQGLLSLTPWVLLVCTRTQRYQQGTTLSLRPILQRTGIGVITLLLHRLACAFPTEFPCSWAATKKSSSTAVPSGAVVLAMSRSPAAAEGRREKNPWCAPAQERALCIEQAAKGSSKREMLPIWGASSLQERLGLDPRALEKYTPRWLVSW